MNPEYEKLTEVMAKALDIQNVTERAAYLDLACHGDAQLRAQIEQLVCAHERAGDFLELSVELRKVLPADNYTGATIGRYKLLREIGEGGFGVVYLAQQVEPVQRQVALKIIKPGMDTREVVARFEAERQALALMDHPNIARVLDAGTTDHERPYFVMELVAGIPLTEYCDQHRLSTTQRLHLFIKVCHAVQHAHQKGIIHRDLKPTNVLVVLQDGEPVPKIIDFGVAKALGQKLTEKTYFTAFQKFVGTPAYMSPEQAGLSGLDVDTRSDIYSLGVLLYELLTGVTPFDPETLHQAALDEIRRMIREAEPPKPSTRLERLGEKLTEVAGHRGTEPFLLRRLVRGDLDWIVMKALEKDRSRRYETANSLAHDIEQHLRHETVQAAAPTFSYRLGKFARRHRTVLSTAVAFVLLLVTASIVSLREASQARQSATQAAQQADRASKLAVQESRQRQLASASAEESHERLVRLNLATANRLLDDGDYLGALPWLAEVLNLDRDRPDRASLHHLRLTAAIKQSPRLLHMWFHSGPVNTAQFNHGGQFVLTASEDGTAQVWDASTGERVAPPLQHPFGVACACFSPNDHLVLTGAADRARLWNAQDGQLLLTVDHEQLEDATFSPDGRLFATASRNGTINIWEVASGRLVRDLLHRAGGRVSQHRAVVAFSPDGKRLLTAAYDGRACIWDVESGALLHSLRENSDIRYSVFSPDGARVATADWSGSVHLWDVETGELLGPLLGHHSMVDHVSFSPGGEFVVTSSIDGTARMWDTRSRSLLRGYGDGKTFVMASSFSPDSGQLLLRYYTGPVRAWSASSLRALSPPLPHGGRPTDAVFHPDGRRVLTACTDGTVRLWDLQPETSAWRPWKRGSFATVNISPSGRRLLSANMAGLQLWDASSWRSNAVTLSLTNNRFQTCFSADEEHLLTAEFFSRESGSGLHFIVWDLATGRSSYQTTVLTASRVPESMTFSASPDLLRVTLGVDLFAEAWDIARAEMLWRSGPHPSRVSLVRYTPDACRVAINSGRLVYILDAATGKQVGPALTNKLLVSSIEFSPDGRVGAVACSDQSYTDGEVRTWDVLTGQPLLALEHKDGVLCVAFSPDGTRLATGTESRFARIFDSTTGRPLTPYLRHGGQVNAVAFSHDGGLLATGCQDNSLRVWDVQTGEPVTPPLILPDPVLSVGFLVPESYLVAETRGFRRLWNLQPYEAPLYDLIDLARLLAAHRVDPTGVAEPLDPQSLSNSWSRLHARIPQAFSGAVSNGLTSANQASQTIRQLVFVPSRDPTTTSNSIDLSAFYNASLTENLMDEAGNYLASLSRGKQILGGIEFDIRGLLVLSSTESTKRVGHRFPDSLKEIPVERSCSHFHFLLGTDRNEADDKRIGAFIVHYADGQTRELSIIYGQDVRNWWCIPPEDPTDLSLPNAAIVWKGTNPAVQKSRGNLRLYKRTWANPRPEIMVKSIEFTSAVTRCAPFVVALTVESPQPDENDK